jgi:hypothetical protein
MKNPYFHNYRIIEYNPAAILSTQADWILPGHAAITPAHVID